MTGTWGGNRTGELSREDYMDQIEKMAGKKNTSWLRNLSKRELKHLKDMIEEARYKAVDEYKKGVKLYE